MSLRRSFQLECPSEFANHFLLLFEFSKIYSVHIHDIHWIMNKVCNYSTYSFFTGRLLSWLDSVQCSSDCGSGAEGSVCLCTQNSSALISISAICSVAAMSVKKNSHSESMYKSSYWKSEAVLILQKIKKKQKSWCKLNIDEVDFKETFFVLLKVKIFNIRKKVILGWKDNII